MILIRGQRGLRRVFGQAVRIPGSPLEVITLHCRWCNDWRPGNAIKSRGCRNMTWKIFVVVVARLYINIWSILTVVVFVVVVILRVIGGVHLFRYLIKQFGQKGSKVLHALPRIHAKRCALSHVEVLLSKIKRGERVNGNQNAQLAEACKISAAQVCGMRGCQSSSNGSTCSTFGVKNEWP